MLGPNSVPATPHRNDCKHLLLFCRPPGARRLFNGFARAPERIAEARARFGLNFAAQNRLIDTSELCLRKS
jgi:hypothetical protein